MRKTVFATNNFYHIYNRGVDKRRIFEDKNDYFRFLKTLQILNNIKATYLDLRSSFKQEKNRSLASTNNPWVKIHAFCLIPNHFHLLLEQVVDEGITKFLHKIGTAYTKYFNLKYERTGRLFEGTFKAILIDQEEYLLHLSRYIHLNPVELIEPKWEEKGVKNWTKIKKFLFDYKWSSYSIYVGERTWRTIEKLVYKKTIQSYFKSAQSYKNFVLDFVVDDLEGIRDFLVKA